MYKLYKLDYILNATIKIRKCRIKKATEEINIKVIYCDDPSSLENGEIMRINTMYLIVNTY